VSYILNSDINGIAATLWFFKKPVKGLHFLGSRCIEKNSEWFVVCSTASENAEFVGVVHRRQCCRGCRGRDVPLFDLQGSSCVDEPPNI